MAGNKNLDPWRALGHRRGESAYPDFSFQRGKHALDVLAGSQRIDVVIDAAAGIVAVLEIADFNVLAAA